MAGSDKPTPPPPKAPDRRTDRQEDTIVKDRVQKPRRYKVVLHNDDFTPMEFVVLVLQQVFRKTSAESTRIMLTVHTTGIGIAGVFPLEVAESKAQITNSLAREAGYPLLVTTEPE